MPGKVDMDRIMSRYSQLSSGSFWTPKEGLNTIRILPPWNDDGLFYKEAPSHFSVGRENKMFVCALKLGIGACPICEEVGRMIKSNNPDEVRKAEDMRVQLRILYNIIDMDDINSGVQVFSSGPKIFRDILSFFADPDWGDLTDPINGYDIVIERQGSGFNTRYNVRPRKNPSPIPNPDLLDLLQDLDQFVQLPNSDAVKDALGYEGFEPSAPARQPSAPQPVTTPKAPTPATKEAIKEALAQKATEAPADKPKPKCFGKLYDEKTCGDCEFKEECGANCKAGRPEDTGDLAAKIRAKLSEGK